MEQEPVQRAQPKQTAGPPEVEEVVVEEGDTNLLNDIDELLDEIDAVLEDQSILVEFRQRSGQ
ncbi:MAG TPA: hypothetical protein VG034_15190 [Acidimicrobiia bacterium]|jgi:hypothetical protein|nr:hypothetical protein [Acidimicrobiia bacterium]